MQNSRKSVSLCDISYCLDYTPIMRIMQRNVIEIKIIDNGGSKSFARDYNNLMRAYCEKYDDCTFVEHTKSPLFYDNPEDIGSYEKIRTDIFVEDQVHYNQKGYDAYREFFLEVLDDIL